VSARKDADRIAALVSAVDALAEGRPATLGDLAALVFGWRPERVYLAIDAAIGANLIAKASDTDPAPPPRTCPCPFADGGIHDLGCALFAKAAQ
jgi:hypothetical protein